MGNAVKKQSESVTRDGRIVRETTRKGISKGEAEEERKRDGEIPFATMLRHRIRYFTAGAVIGSRSFVDEVFTRSRDRFSPKRKSGARRMKGDAAAAGDRLWSLRDLRKGIV